MWGDHGKDYNFFERQNEDKELKPTLSQPGTSRCNILILSLIFSLLTWYQFTGRFTVRHIADVVMAIIKHFGQV